MAAACMAATCWSDGAGRRTLTTYSGDRLSQSMDLISFWPSKSSSPSRLTKVTIATFHRMTGSPVMSEVDCFVSKGGELTGKQRGFLGQFEGKLTLFWSGKVR